MNLFLIQINDKLYHFTTENFIPDDELLIK